MGTKINNYKKENRKVAIAREGQEEKPPNLQALIKIRRDVEQKGR